MNRIEDVTNYITECDKEVGEALSLELGRQRRNLELIASENIVSPAVMLAMGTVPTNKYAEGYPGKRYYGGCEDVDILENLAIERAKELFGCEHVCVQPHSGANANTGTRGHGYGIKSCTRRTSDTWFTGEFIRNLISLRTIQCERRRISGL